jgi:hypothetical protein
MAITCSLHTILAVQTGGSAFKVFARAELGACTYFCPNSNILDKRIKTNCILELFNREQEVITAHCPWISIAATDFNIQLGANRFLLYLANSKEVQLVCGKESATRSFHGLQQLTVPAIVYRVLHYGGTAKLFVIRRHLHRKAR